jgi:hypothetical protein
MKIFVLLAMMMFSISCNHSKDECRNLTLNRVYVDRMGNGNLESFSHYLVLEGYNDRCFEHTSFFKLMRSYWDTCKVSRPIQLIHFIRTGEGVGFETNEPDFELLKEKQILSFGLNYRSDTLIVENIYFYQNGEEKRLNVKGIANIDLYGF